MKVFYIDVNLTLIVINGVVKPTEFGWLLLKHMIKP